MQTNIALILLLLVYSCRSNGYSELVEELGCHNDDFRLICDPLSAQIVILETNFRPNGTCHLWNSSKLNSTSKSFRHTINKRCSGRNTCNFKMTEDVPGASEWGPGLVYLRYACLDDIHVLKTCTAQVEIKGEGFLQTPGYPRFYVGGRKCHWTLKTRAHRQIQIQFLDISIRELAPFDKNCRDLLIVTEHGLNLLSTCNDTCQHYCDPITIVSAGPEINITLITSSVNIFPKRGVLVHFKPVGCSLPRLGRGATFVGQLDDAAQFACPQGAVFEDIGLRVRTVQCGDPPVLGRLPDCIILNDQPSLKGDNMNETSAISHGNNEDLVTPCTVMAIIFIVNAVIVWIVFRYKKRLDTEKDPWRRDESWQPLKSRKKEGI